MQNLFNPAILEKALISWISWTFWFVLLFGINYFLKSKRLKSLLTLTNYGVILILILLGLGYSNYQDQAKKFKWDADNERSFLIDFKRGIDRQPLQLTDEQKNELGYCVLHQVEIRFPNGIARDSIQKVVQDIGVPCLTQIAQTNNN